VSRVRVLVINTVNFQLNGITSVILNYYRNMDKTGMKVDFVVPNEIDSDYRNEFKKNQSEIYYIPRNCHPLNYFVKLYKIIKDKSYDIVHVHGNSATMTLDILPASLAKVPVRIVHAHSTSCSHKVLHKLLFPIFNKCFTHAFACGEDAGKWLYKTLPFVELKNGIEMKKYRYSERIRKEYRQKINAGNRIVIGHVGNFVPPKNHSFLLDWYAELIKKNDNYQLLLIGDGEYLELMREKANALNISANVVFLGKTTEVNNFLQAMDIFVLPSLHEGLSVALVEAQAAGLPCFVADTVSRESDLTKSLTFLSIKDVQPWINEIERMNPFERNREDKSFEWQSKIIGAGYDIAKEADLMRELYIEYINNRLEKK